MVSHRCSSGSEMAPTVQHTVVADVGEQHAGSGARRAEAGLVVLKSAKSKRTLSVLKLFGEPKVTGNLISRSGLAEEPGVIPKKGGDDLNELGICRVSSASAKGRFIELPLLTSTRPRRMFCTMGSTTMG